MPPWSSEDKVKSEKSEKENKEIHTESLTSLFQ